MLYQSLRVRIGLRAGDAGSAGNENPFLVGPLFGLANIPHPLRLLFSSATGGLRGQAMDPAQDLVDLLVGADAPGGLERGGADAEVSLVEADHALEIAGALVLGVGGEEPRELGAGGGGAGGVGGEGAEARAAAEGREEAQLEAVQRLGVARAAAEVDGAEVV